jgi:hypothetical protein
VIGGYNVYSSFERGYRKIILNEQEFVETKLVFYSVKEESDENK